MLSFSDVSYGWSEKQLLQKNLTFDLKEGSINVLLGTNGCGKSTLFSLLGGERIFHKGDIRCLGRNFADFTIRERATTFGIIGQRPANYGAMNVLSYMQTAWYPFLSIFAHPGAEERRGSLESLEKLGILQWKDRPLQQLSYGEMRLVQLARALVGGRKILLLDEVDSALDFANRIHFSDVIRSLVREGKVVFMITHDPNLALALESQVLLLGKNTPSLFGSSRDVITPENISRFFGVKVIKTRSCNSRIEQIVADFNGRSIF
ncbi:MAG: ABC transporter ATP-binding protein [Succinivibrionaceae bacterium]